ncbi:MAG: M14 family metallopeptidase, partial [Phycisphaerae bacterium]
MKKRFVFRFVVAAALTVVAAHADVTRYDGESVIRIQVVDDAQLDQILKLTDDVWSHEIGVGPLDIRVNETQRATIDAMGWTYSVMIEDIQQQIDANRASVALGAGTYDDYMPYADVIAYLNGLVSSRPDLAQIEVIGQSLEGRDMTAIRITGPGDSTGRPEVFYHGGIHSREWITVPTAMYFADQLVSHYDTDAQIKDLVDRCIFYVMPVTNPDGYVATWNGERLWRKNRRGNGSSIYGVDLNRNFGYEWGGPGSSGVQSSETYRGPSAFSEPETQAIRDFFVAHPNIVAYNDIHSYSELILWPWGYAEAYTPDEAEFARIGFTMRAIIASVHGHLYTAGPIGITLYLASGGSVDWAYGSQGVMGYSYELRDTGSFGFLLPPDQIIPTCEEIFPSLIYYAEEMSVPLRIAFPNGRPDLAAPDQPATIEVAIIDNVEMVDPSSAMLFARTSPSGPFVAYPLLPLGGEDYQATLPGRGCGMPTEYYVSASSMSGATIVQPAGAPDNVYTLPIGEVFESFRDEFESESGWTVVSDAGMTSGQWERADPVGTTNGGNLFQPENDVTPAGTDCFVTENGNVGGSYSANDVDGGPTILTSPLFNLAGMIDPRISYHRWAASSADDVLRVEVSVDEVDWLLLETVPDERAWGQVEFRIFDYLPNANTMRIR